MYAPELSFLDQIIREPDSVVGSKTKSLMSIFTTALVERVGHEIIPNLEESTTTRALIRTCVVKSILIFSKVEVKVAGTMIRVVLTKAFDVHSGFLVLKRPILPPRVYVKIASFQAHTFS